MLSTTFKTEREMYPQVCDWLKRFLQDSYAKSDVQVFDSSRKSLPKLIQENGFVTNLSPEWPSWDIQVDIVGFILYEHVTKLAFVECKNIPITLAHLSQLLGYSRVALPEYALVLSPYGASASLKSLLVTHKRADILQYHQERGKMAKSVMVAKWDEQARCIDYSTLISGDMNYLGRL